ncbi:MAG: glycoside hydrolase family 3 C-terminal domain-containing protein, partial [Thermoanaerobaculia bacterium]|nr:glycoside hydrolase family 3 C-terminal domain-containing protein [Thermoanaerobaculia bacterium]
VRRILKAKRRIDTVPFDPDRIFRGVDRPDHYRVALETAQRAITLVKHDGNTLPVNPASNVIEIVIGDFPDKPGLMTTFHRELSRRLEDPPERFVLDRRSGPDDLAPIRAAVDRADLVILALTVRTRSGEGAVAIPAMARDLVEEISIAEKKRSIALSFGSPYLLRELPFLETYLAAYGIQPVMQKAAVRAIFGETAIEGRLPVTIPGTAIRGRGIRRSPDR